MKKLLTITISLTFATAAVRADLANYQSTVNGSANLLYYNTLDSATALAPTVGTGTFTSTGTSYGLDYWGNANSAVTYPTVVTDYLSLPNSAVISQAGSATGIGSLSMLFYLPSTVPTTGYLFSDSETTGSMFAFDISGGNTFQLKLGSITKSLTGALPAPAVTANTWYYLAVTYDRTGVAPGVNGVNYYLGVVGGSLSSGFIQNGGTGNISATSTLGANGSFILGSRLGTKNSMGVDSAVDEFATWSSQLTATDIQNQFSALTTTVPEPSTCALLGLSGLLVLWVRRTFRA